MDPIYLDYNATTPLDPRVAVTIQPYLERLFGNPSSSHLFGNQAAQAVMTARKQVAAMLHCHSDEVVFTAGGTESNNWAIKGIAFANRGKGNHIITTRIEHPAVDAVCRFLGEQGFEITRVAVDSSGVVDPDEIRRAVRAGTILITVMHANNETGSIQPLAEIGKIAGEAGILFHSDAAQSAGKIPVDVRDLGVSLLSVAGHKCYAPKGVGALFIRRGVQLDNLMHGAGQETGRRAGTENVIGIVGLGRAAELVGSGQLAVGNGQWAMGSRKLQVLRDRLHEGICREIPEVRLNGHPDLRLPNTLSLGFPGVEANLLLQAMPGIAASAGAACHAGARGGSGVLAAMQVPDEYAIGTIRFSVGRMTTGEEIDRALPVIVNAYREVQGSRFKVQDFGLQVQDFGLKVQDSRVKVKTKDIGNGIRYPTSDIRHPISNLQDPVSSHPVIQSSSIQHAGSGIRLTEYTHALGCACKIRPQVLEEVLRKLPALCDPKVLVGPSGSDDAAVYQLNEEQAVVQTVDVIPPVVDDPYTFGMIAAANALSDVYAMGGSALFALNIVGFPESRLPLEVLHRIQEGASAKAAEAGIQILGGHSIALSEPFFGLAVTGVVKPDAVIRNHGLKSGDSLVLTKPVGTGILTTALKRDLLTEGQRRELIDSMASLNKTASEIMTRFGAHACTDITGFGLLGHLREMIAGEALTIVLNVPDIPLLAGVEDAAAQGVIPGGTRNNLDYIGPFVSWGEGVPELFRLILCDAQTSGGLVIGLPGEEAGTLVTALGEAGIDHAAVIGRVVSGEGKLTIQMQAP